MRLQADVLSKLALYQTGGTKKGVRDRRLHSLFKRFGVDGYIPTTQEVTDHFQKIRLSKKEVISLRRSFIYRVKNNTTFELIKKGIEPVSFKLKAKRKRAIKDRLGSNRDDFSSEVYKCPKLLAILEDINSRHGAEILKRGEKTRINEGFIYLLEHPLFNGWVKGGMTVDYIRRLEVFNQADPLARFSYLWVYWVENRKVAENRLLAALSKKAKITRGEWFQLDKHIALTVIRVLHD